MKVAQTSSNKKPSSGMCEYQTGGVASVLGSTKLIRTPGPLTGYSSIPALYSCSRSTKIDHGDGRGPVTPSAAFQSHLLWQQRKKPEWNYFTHREILNIHTLLQPLFQSIWQLFYWLGSLLYARSRSYILNGNEKKILCL